MNSKWFFAVIAAIVSACVLCPAIYGAQPVYSDIHGNWVTFDREVNWGYNPEYPHSIIFYPNTRSVAFSVTYQDVASGTGTGFDDATQGAARRARVEDALAYVASILAGETGGADIHFAPSYSNSGDPKLASCGPMFWTGPNGFYGGFVHQHITTGSKPSPGNPDAVAQWNFGHNWYTGTGNPGGSQYDMISVMIHEMGHGLGFSSLVDYGTGNSVISGTNPGVFSFYDFYLINGNGQNLFNTVGGAQFIGNAVNDLIGLNNGLFFTGPEAVTEYGSNPPIYAPNPWEDGSSVSHWSLAAPVLAVMLPFYSPGTTRREFLDFEIATFADIGYDVDSEPVPPTPTPGGPPTPTPEPVIDVPATGPLGLGLMIGLLTLLIGFSNKKRK